MSVRIANREDPDQTKKQSDRAFSSDFGKRPWPKLGKNDRLILTWNIVSHK